jgi:hypothetical protein
MSVCVFLGSKEETQKLFVKLYINFAKSNSPSAAASQHWKQSSLKG